MIKVAKWLKAVLSGCSQPATKGMAAMSLAVLLFIRTVALAFDKEKAAAVLVASSFQTESVNFLGAMAYTS
jgi:hypothetical protein